MRVGMSLAGTGSLMRLALRRDRVLLPTWLVVFVVMAAGSASATVGLYDTVASRRAAAASLNSTPSLVALYGLIYDESSLGALAMIKLGAFGGALVAVLATVLVIRHSRAEEEAGRLELVGSTVVGRHAPLAAALLVTIGTIVALGLLTAIGLIGSGLPVPGSVAFGLAWAGIGIAFAAVAAVAAQVTSTARSAIGIAVAFLGLVYVFRAVADTAAGDTIAGDTAAGDGVGWLRWLSPIGWGQQVRPYQGDRWWVLLVPLAFALVVAAAAHVLLAHRDHGAGLLPDRPGPAHAGADLLGAPGLAWRLHRGGLAGWTAGFLAIGLVFGNVAGNVGDFLDSPGARELIQKLGGVQGLTDAFLSTELGMAGVIASAYGIQVVLRLRSEEAALHAEPVLATAVGRAAWVLSHVTVALLGTATLLVVSGLGAGLAYAAQTGRSGDIWRVLAASLVRLPATWVLTGIVVAAFGLAPRASTVGWAALVAFLLLGEFGPVLGLDQSVMNLSPFAHVPRLPGGDYSTAPIVWLGLISLALVAAGVLGFRRRDVPVT